LGETLIKLQKEELFHGSLHPGNILLSEKNDLRLSDYGFAYTKHYDYSNTKYSDFIHPEYMKLTTLDKLTRPQKEKI